MSHQYFDWLSVEEFLEQEGLVLLEMRVKQLIKENQLGKAALLAKTCSQCPAFQGKGPFKQMYLVCLCATSEQNQLMDEVSGATELRQPHLYLFVVQENSTVEYQLKYHINKQY